jgi:hypothetical protein
MADFKKLKMLKIKNCAVSPYCKMTPIQDGGQINVKLSGGIKTKGLGTTLSKVICIIIHSLYINQRQVNIN